MIIKMKKHKLCSNETLIDLSEGTLRRKSFKKALQLPFLIKCKFKNKTKNKKTNKKTSELNNRKRQRQT